MNILPPNAQVNRDAKQIPSMWDWLLVKPYRKALSRLRWKVLQQGELVEDHWSAMCTQWRMEQGVSRDLEIPSTPTRLLSTVRSFEDSTDGTVKFQLQTPDQLSIEAVLIPASKSNRATACVSSQVGCGVDCSFCATGQLGLLRNLHYHEILEQLLVVRQAAAERKLQLRNVVFMGMGEPLHNWPQVKQAIHWMLRDDGFYISPAHLCVSTSGVLNNLRLCAQDYRQIRLAISLHSCDQEVRKQLVPKGVGSVQAIREFLWELHREMPERPVWLEMVMIDGVTDRDQDIELLLQFCQGLHVEINLIPFNDSQRSDSTESSMILRRSNRDRIWEIAQQLRAAGYFTTIRHSGGQNIAAACGQLAASIPLTSHQD